ncbi:hypothetical protein PR202_ga07868 [Eleusine coracana subsp. coracana]|uniref:Uncharacterized protein n=1 Tax=Eleusine coracana subsp. coracana TaxID=191504 RepID=A0AAV5BZU8_ELECO|nr:hypothetical protein PR202_ga07868 [Eleusine coracana subsp. coracana]
MHRLPPQVAKTKAVQEHVERQVLALVLGGVPLGEVVKVQEQELVLEEGAVGCASTYYSYNFSRRNIAVYEQAPVKQLVVQLPAGQPREISQHFKQLRPSPN